MSRSYKKPYVKDGYGSKRKRFRKNYANRVVRNSKNVPDGKAFKKFFCSYNICDYQFYVELKKEKGWLYEREFWKYSRK